MALKHEGYPCSVWDDWSRRGSKYHEGECEKKWRSFNEETGEIVTGATITQLAKDRGWTNEDKSFDPFHFTLTDADLYGADYVTDPACLEPEEIHVPAAGEWEPVQDVIDYLRALFRDDEHVGLALNSFQDEDGKWKPRQGSSQKTAGEWVAELRAEQQKAGRKSRVDMVLGSLQNEAAGGWVNINPLDGEGTKNANVTDFRYALVESDAMPLEKQLALIRSMKLPCAAIVYSGGKSVHAVVHVDAVTLKEYRERVDKLYEVCNKNGFSVDGQNKNPARLTRLPGVTRNGVPQFLIDSKCGAENWDAWMNWLGEAQDDLPPFEELDAILANLPPYSPTLIDGILRMGHKMLVTGPSKAGKSFLLIELSIALASGRTWLKWKCRQGKVLYLNLEIDAASMAHRFDDMYKIFGAEIEKESRQNLTLWNLRGVVKQLPDLAKLIERRIAGRGYSAIIIDPLYKVLLCDENSAQDVATAGAWLDYIARKTGCAVIYCHHHSKGAQGMKRSADRGSGSGVFARDADAILDLTPLELSDDQMTDDATPAYCVSGTLREFACFDDFAVRFKHPIHEIDYELDPKKTEGSLEGNRIKGNQAQTANKNNRIEEFREKLEKHLQRGDKVTQADMAEEIGVSLRTAKTYIKTLNEDEPIYVVENGRGGCIKWADTL